MNRASMLFALCLVLSASGQQNDAAHVFQTGTIYKEVRLHGNPYYEEEFKTGQVELNGERRILKCRLNAYKGQIEVQDRNGRKFVLARKNGQEVIFGGRRFILMPYFDGDNLREDYCIPLLSGKANFLLMPRKTFRQAKLPEYGYDAYKPATYEDTSIYFIQIGNGNAEPVRLNKNSLLKALGSHKSELKDYIKTYALDLSTQEGAAALVNYYNRLE